MASSSRQSSSSTLMTLTRKYDVFVSFRGKDTRYNFTDHLFGALQRKGIVAFKDDTKLKKGEPIAPELLRAIEGSLVFIVVFSKNYASSTWCLGELEQIFDCVQLSGKRVLPIFYDVDPSEVRHQKGSYAEAFAKHEERFKQDSEMVGRWRATLTQVANLSGWDVRHKPQYAEIGKIVEEIINILGHKFSSLPNDLVGMRSPIEILEKLLLLDSVDDVRAVGISGMGGIGKTTLATVLYGRIFHQFGASCFIDDTSKIYRHDGPIGVHKQILHQTLGEEHLQICNLYNAVNLTRSRLRYVKAFIILDNVDQVEQIETLAVNREWLDAGSRIIVISRDEHILKEYGVDAVYKVPLLNQADSLQLFCRKAFKHDNIMSNYEELAHDILYYANGLPLAIKVLGSFLFGRDTSEWRSALARLRESPNKDIMDVLRISFDGLEEMEKEIFLDIACFFNVSEEEYVKNVLNCCGFHPDIGLRVLIDKSLISIEHDEGSERWIKMPDLLQELGRKIVLENSTKEPRKWSRLWFHKYFYNVMLENMEKNVEAIVLNGCERETEIFMAEVLSKMSHLRLLILRNVNFPGSINCLSNELRYVEWREYPFTYLPSSFQPIQLVELILKHSNINQLWEGKKYLPNLRTLDLSHSKNLIKMPDFGEVPNLEHLNLEECVKLVKIDPSIGVLRKLVFLNMRNCKSLNSIPINIFVLSSLKYLKLGGCSKVYKSCIFNWYPTAHKDLLPSLTSFFCLRELDISYCGLRQIPDAIGCMRWLERLDLGGNNFVTLPSLRDLSNLVYLNLEHCKRLKSLSGLPSPAAIKQDHHLLSIIKDWWEATLYMFNCPKLGESERCRSMTFSWMIQFIQANQESSASFPHCIDIKIVIPGNEVPVWFHNQSVGDSISLELSPILHDNNFIGIAFCVVFFVAPCGPTTTINDPSLTLCFYSNNSRRFCVIMSLFDHRVLIMVKANHMCLLYFTRESFFKTLRNTDYKALEHLDDFFVDASLSSDLGLDREVKNCGYRLVFKEDLEQLNNDSSGKFLSSEAQIFGN